MLYELSLSTPKKGFSRGPVKAVPATGLLCDRDETGALVSPDKEAIRDCLPHYYRAAFDRCKGMTQTSGRAGFRFDLRDSRGSILNYVYAVPSHIPAGMEAI